MERVVQELKTDWLYTPKDLKAAARRRCDESAFAPVSLPHTNVELPYHGFSEREHCFVSWYRRHVRLPKSALRNGRRVFLDFDGAMIATTVFVNGKPAGSEHRGGYTPFTFDITDLLDPSPNADNVLSVRVDSTERNDIPPFGNVVDYLTFGGIYREVRLRIVDPVFIERIFARPKDVLSAKKHLEITTRLVNTTDEPQPVKLHAQLNDPASRGKHWNAPRVDLTIPAGQSVDVDSVITDIPGIKLWDLDNPTLYNVVVALEDDHDRDRIGDSVSTRVGFRAAEFRDDGSFYLNNQPLKLRGLNRHQTFPYIGAAAPARLQRKDADILKLDLGCNIVRTSHYPQSPHFLDRCDELGLLVFEEIPGWQHIGDAAWKNVALRDVRAMIERDRNHPSIILWGVRINESGDDHDFYAATNAVARQLDPTRQTGGVRFNYDSERLEDVFTMNDFNYDLRPPRHPRYLNTEFAGHMYSTKTFDQEERVRQHAIHHAHVLSQVYGMKSAGAIGWCAFDYNTHAVFGSGDRICYHGVMDIFRQPKFASYVYASQVDPKTRIVLEPATYWKMGDKSGAGVEPMLILTNCDEVEVVVGAESRGRFTPDRTAFPHVPHPPVVATNLGSMWGGHWHPLTVHGYINGKRVATKQIANDGIPARLELAADDPAILADSSDMTRLSLRITDAFGNILPFQMQPVQLTLTGPGVLVGENPFSLPGGRGAVYVRSTRTPGQVTVTASTPRLKPQKVTIRTTRA